MASSSRPVNDDVKLAAREGLARGLREHLPGATGIVAKGIPLCALGAYTHLILGISVPGSAISVALTGVGVGGSAWFGAHRNQRLELPRQDAGLTR